MRKNYFQEGVTSGWLNLIEILKLYMQAISIIIEHKEVGYDIALRFVEHRKCRPGFGIELYDDIDHLFEGIIVKPKLSLYLIVMLFDKLIKIFLNNVYRIFYQVVLRAYAF